MSADLAQVEPDVSVYRLGRQPDPWAWPDWAYAGADGTFGNRYDDPRASYRVIYACSQRLGAFVETLARFRPDLELVAELEEIDGDEEPPPGLPRAWLHSRAIGEATLTGRFVDVGDARSLATIRTELAAGAIHHRLDEIDAAVIRLRAPREFTQTISRHIYEQTDDHGTFAGICYRSRLGDQFINWAIFEPLPGAGYPLTNMRSAAIAPDDVDLIEALRLLGLQLL